MSCLSGHGELAPENTSVNTTDACTDVQQASQPVKVYRRRWWILGVFCATTFTQGVLWNTWSPIGDAVLIGFGWEASFLALCLCMSSVGVSVLAFPFMYCIETRGLRLGLVIASSMLALGTAAWNIALPTNQDWLTVIGSLLCGIVSSITVSAAPILSVLWFPASEQTTATAAITMIGGIGVGVPFITGPYLSGANITATMIQHRDELPPDYIASLRQGIQHVVYFSTALAFISFVMVMSYFPAKPKQPPNRSQTKERMEYWASMSAVVRNPQFWLLNLSYNLVNGAYYSWVPLSAVNFTKSLEVDEATTGWIGFTSTVVGCAGSICMAVVMDRFKRKSKFVILSMTVATTALFALMGCVQQHYITIPEQYIVATLYVLCISLSICVNGITPLCYELVCEVTYPAYEGIASTFLNVFNNLSGPLFYGLFLVPSLARDLIWMTWVCMVVSALSVPLLVAMKEQYLRLDVESTETRVEPNQPVAVNS